MLTERLLSSKLRNARRPFYGAPPNSSAALRPPLPVDVRLHSPRRSADHSAFSKNENEPCWPGRVATAHGVDESTAANELLGPQGDGSQPPAETPEAKSSYAGAKVDAKTGRPNAAAET
jgi:hypothetical protein